MKRGAAIAAAGLALLAGGAWALRAGRGAESVSRSAPPAFSPSGLTAPAASPIADSDPEALAAANKALRLVELFRQIEKPGQPKAHVESLEREAADLGSALADQLRAAPRLWRQVIDLLSCVEHLQPVLRAARVLAPALEDSIEPQLVDLVRQGRTVPGRRVGVALLDPRHSSETLGVLIAAAEGDADPGVRLAAMTALFHRHQRAPSAEVSLSIEEALRRCATLEPSPNIRALAANMVPGQRPAPPSKPPPKKPRLSTGLSKPTEGASLPPK